MHSLSKFLSETNITLLCNICCFRHKRGYKRNFDFSIFHPILMQFFFLQSVHLIELLMGHNKFGAILFHLNVLLMGY
jgi:hypothetical protein